MRRVVCLLVVLACGDDANPVVHGDAATEPMVDAAMVDADAAVDPHPSGIGGPPVGTCFDQWCWVAPLPQGYAIASVWGASSTDVWMVSAEGTPYHYDGVNWTRHAPLGDWGEQVVLHGTASNDVWATSTSKGVLHWNGTSWSVSAANLNGPTVMGVIDSSHAWISDPNGFETHEWNGTQWVTHGAVPIKPIAFGGSASVPLAVSNAGAIAKWTGTAWGVLDGGSHANNAAVAIDATHVVVAQTDAVSFWDNGTWTTRATPVAGEWNKIAATSSTDVWVAGPPNKFYHWDGNAWTDVSDPASPGAMTALSVRGGTVFVGTAAASVRARNGTTWNAVTVADNVIGSVWGTAATDIWAVNSNTSFVPNRTRHWNGTSWSDVAMPFQTNYVIRQIWGSAPNNYWIAAGYWHNNVVDRMLLHWDGSTWTALGPYGTENGVVGPEGFTGVWGSGANDVYAVAPNAVYHRDATGWSQVTELSGGSNVFGTSASDVFVLKGTTLWHWNGTAWSSKTTPASFAGGWANSPTDVWFVADYGRQWHYDGDVFVDLQIDQGQGIPIGTATEMFTFDRDENMIRWAGGAGGTRTTTTQVFSPRAGWVAPDGHVWAAAFGSHGNGLLVH